MNITLEQKRHSTAHLLAMAVTELFSDVKFGIGPVIENGFYYDFDLSSKISEDDLPKLELIMKKLIKQDLSFKREEVTIDQAREFFSQQPYKLELINDLSQEGKADVSLYKTGDFTDLCRGGHVDSTAEIDPESFKLVKIAGAYWRGDENRPMLQRIYGVLFNSTNELSDYLNQVAEAEKRDHKKLGKELDLFIFSDLIGPGLPLWTPKGTIVRNLLDDFVWQLRASYGYQKVTIPHLTKKDLYEKSGHWSKFADELFRIKTREGHEFALKPMNCPHHAQIYASRQRSYKDLPERYTETTMVYRDEQTGELGGLSRVRSITQDDAHVFCRKSQIKSEVDSIWQIVNTFYARFGFDLTVRFSRHDPANFDQYLGTKEIWQSAEQELKEIIDSHKVAVIDGLGEAALYGPKIDFMGRDAIGRLHQLATIQLDFNQSERFDLYCINETGEHERIVMIHAAIMGSLERFMAILIEHYAGAFPTWLAPVQISIIPVSDKFNNYAQDYIVKPLAEAGFRVELNDDNESVGKKIRSAVTQKIPYSLVIGEKEIESNQLAIRSRDHGELETMTMAQFITYVNKETA